MLFAQFYVFRLSVYIQTHTTHTPQTHTTYTHPHPHHTPTHTHTTQTHTPHHTHPHHTHTHKHTHTHTHTPTPHTHAHHTQRFLSRNSYNFTSRRTSVFSFDFYKILCQVILLRKIKFSVKLFCNEKYNPCSVISY